MTRYFAGLLAAPAALVAAASTAFALCAPVAEAPRARAWPVVDLPAQLPPKGSVEISYIGHSTFLIRTPGGISAATDYNDHIRPPITPTIAIAPSRAASTDAVIGRRGSPGTSSSPARR